MQRELLAKDEHLTQKIVALYYSYMETYDGMGSFSSIGLNPIFSLTMVSFPRVSNKQHAAKSCYIHESELPYKVELSFTTVLPTISTRV